MNTLSVLFHSDLVNQKAFPCFHTPAAERPERILSVCRELSSCTYTEALKTCLLFPEISENGFIKVKARDVAYVRFE